MSAPVVVVGSGMSGSVAALAIAAAGRDVLVVEQAPHVAPLLRGFRRGDLLCDTGFHYSGGLGQGGFLRRLFGRFGILEHIESVAMPSDGFDVLHGRDRTVVVPIGLKEAESAFAEAFPGSRAALGEYFVVVRRVLAETPLLNPDVPPWEARRGPEDEISVAAFLADRGAEPELIFLLGTYAGLLCGLRVDEAPLRTHTAVLGSYFQSAHLVVDGGEAIAGALEVALARAGIRVECSRAATGLEVSDTGEVTGVLLDGEDRQPAEAVVFTPHPAHLARILPEGTTRPAYRHRLEALENTPAVFVTYLESDEPLPQAERNLYFLNGPDGEASGGLLALMAASPTATGPSRLRAILEPAGPGDLAESLAVPGRERSRRYADWKLRRAREAVDRLASRLPFEKARLDLVAAVSPASYRDWTWTPGGSAYGAKRTVTTLPVVARTPVGGVVLAGQGILVPGIMGAAASGWVAASHVVGAEAAWHALDPL